MTGFSILYLCTFGIGALFPFSKKFGFGSKTGVDLFGEKEGRIAWANRGKDPLYLFAALQRQLGYPVVPKPKRQQPQAESPALMARRIDRLELRVKLLEEETKDGIDLSQFDPKNDLFKESPKD